jgi:hypothetical protein
MPKTGSEGGLTFVHGVVSTVFEPGRGRQHRSGIVRQPGQHIGSYLALERTFSQRRRRLVSLQRACSWRYDKRRTNAGVILKGVKYSLIKDQHVFYHDHMAIEGANED